MYPLMVVLLGAVAAVISNAAVADEPLMKHVQTIPLEGVEGRFDHFGVDLEAKRLYVAALGNNTLEVIDLAAGKRIKTIGGLKKPTSIRVLPGSRNVIIASGDDGKVRIYKPELKLLATVDGLDDADNVRLAPDGKLAYVGYGDGAIAIIDPAQAKKIGDIKLDGHPEAFAVETKGNRIFVNVPTARQIAVIDREKKAVIASWPVHEAESNFPMALVESDHRLFVGCRKPAQVLVIDSNSGKTVSKIDCCGDTDDLFFDDTTKRLYISGGEGCISVIEKAGADQYRALGKIATAPGARTALFVPDMQALYLAVPHRRNQQAEIRVYRTSGP
jgi:YVTN family beta-propeller protein